MTISVIIPTFNEAKNIGILIKKIDECLYDIDYEIIVVDNNSTDGTKELAEKLSKIYSVRFIFKTLDLSNAVLEGFKCTNGDIIGVLDGDLSHPPEKIKEFIKKIEKENYDLVVGTRKKGGSVEKWPLHRKLISKLGEILAKPLSKNCSDPMSGFFFLKRDIINNVNFSPIGYKILLELLVKANFKKFYELPYTFKNRESGQSKLNYKEYSRYMRHLLRLYFFMFSKYLIRRHE